MSERDDGLLPEFVSKPFTRRQLIKGAAVVGAGAAFGPLLGAGSAAGASPPVGAAPKTGGNLRVATPAGSSAENLDIHRPADTIPALNARFQMYDSLLEFSPTGVLGMALAAELVPNKTATQFTVRLKPGLEFQNGKSVTADDVVYSFNRIMNPKNPGLAATQLAGLKPGKTKKIDKLTVRFDLDVANAVFPQALAAYASGIVPVGYNPTGATGAIGTGPFMITTFSPGQQMVFAKNPHYWRTGGGPYVDTLTFTEFSDNTAQLNALLGGTADYCNGIASAQRSIASGAGMVLLTAKTGAWEPFTMRADIKPFSDVRVRQAFRLIVNRPELITNARDGMATLGNDMFGLYDPGYPKNLAQRVQDLAKAKSLLKAAGYGNGLTVTLTTSTGVASTAPADATVFAEQAKGAGVTVNISNVTSDIFWGANYLKYTFAQDNWGTRGYLAQAALGTIPGALYNECHWVNAKYLALYKQAYKTVDNAKRNEIVRELATIDYNEGAYIIHCFDNLVDAHTKNVLGAVAGFSGLATSACDGRYRLMSFA